MSYTFKARLDAIEKLTLDGLDGIFDQGQMSALAAYTQICTLPISMKGYPFYRQLVPMRSEIVKVLAENYRRYLKLALANLYDTGDDPDKWAWEQLQPAVQAALERLHDWIVLACDGENQYVRKSASMPIAMGETVSIPIRLAVPLSPPREAWRAPAWLFEVSDALVGVGAIESDQRPNTNSEEKLSEALTLAVLEGAMRVFLRELKTGINTVRNEEIAAPGAIPGKVVGEQLGVSNDQKGTNQPRGFEGLGPKNLDLSRYAHVLTEKQQLAYSLRLEYGLPLAETASRMGIDRKTAYEHIEAAKKRINEAYSAQRRNARRAKETAE